MQEFEVYLFAAKSLIRLMDLTGMIVHTSRIWFHWITTQAAMEIDDCPFFYLPSSAKTDMAFSCQFKCKWDKYVHRFIPDSLFCKHNLCYLLIVTLWLLDPTVKYLTSEHIMETSFFRAAESYSNIRGICLLITGSLSFLLTCEWNCFYNKLASL